MGGTRGNRRSRSRAQRPRHFEWRHPNHQRIVRGSLKRFQHHQRRYYRDDRFGQPQGQSADSLSGRLWHQRYRHDDTTTTAPAAPASVSATATSSTSVTVSWSASTGATGYDLYELENGQAVLIGSYAAGTTSASVTGLTATPPIRSRLPPTTAPDRTPPAGRRSRRPRPLPRSRPRRISTSPPPAARRPTLSWQAVSGATGYRVYRVERQCRPC